MYNETCDEYIRNILDSKYEYWKFLSKKYSIK